MKTIALTLIGILIFASTIFAVTDTQLEEAENTLRQMDSIIAELRGYVQRAYSGVIENITLTSEQKQQLINEYLSLKTQLPALYQDLP